MPTITELSNRAGDLARSMSVRAHLSPYSPMLFGLASGFDVALTIIEQSTGARFNSLSPEAAQIIVRYFGEEAARSEAMDPQIAIFYRSWAQVVTSAYLGTSASE